MLEKRSSTTATTTTTRFSRTQAFSLPVFSHRSSLIIAADIDRFRKCADQYHTGDDEVDSPSPMHLECFGLDCMLRHRKNQLVRELWRASASLRGNSGQSSMIVGSADVLDMKMKSTLNSILKRLDVDELELLLESVKSKGRSHSQCIHLTERLSGVSTHQPSSLTLSSKDMLSDTGHAVCKAWRWPDLSSSDNLTQLPNCQIPYRGESTDECHSRCCVNPYHWCKVLDIISDLKPIKCQPALEQVYLHGKVDLDNNTELTYNDSTDVEWRSDNWCQVAYWELSQRIGQLFPVTPSSIDIFQDVAQGCGVSLDTLHKTHSPKSPAIAKLRSKIGAGITLSKEGNLVCLYNRSEGDVFVTSYCLNIDKRSGDTWRVCKLLPGHSIVIYDYSILQSRPMIVDSLAEGPTDPHSIHLSFVKGWSGSYSRQTVLSCECWLEILINKKRFQVT